MRLFALLLTLSAIGLAQTPHSNTLSWNWSQGSGDAATGFHVWKSATPGGPYTTPLATVPVASLTYVDSAVVAGQTNYYVVSAYNTAGDSTKSSEVACTTPFHTPVSPTGLSATSQ